MRPNHRPAAARPIPQRPCHLVGAASLMIALSGLVSAAEAPSPQRSLARAVTILSLGSGLQVLVGSQPVGGDPLEPPRFTWHAESEGASTWSPLHRLTPAGIGHLVPLRGSAWRLETAGFDPGGALHHRLLPLSPELGLVGGRFEALQGVARLRVARVDDWTLVVAEQAASGAMLLRRIVANGSSMELEVTDQLDWPTAWPPGTQLVALDANADQVVAWGRDEAGNVHLASLANAAANALENPATLPPLALDPSALVTGVLLKDGPAVLSLAAGKLSLHVLGANGWNAADDLPWPSDAPTTALAARARGKARDEIVVAVAGPIASEDGAPAVTVTTHDASGWHAPIRLQEAAAAATLAAIPGAAEPIESAGGMSRLMLAAAALTAAAALSVAITQVRALLRRR